MPTQVTSPATIEREKVIIRNIAGLPDVTDIYLNDRGWDSRVYSFAEDRYFFKFPRSAKIQNRYKYEIAAIKYLDKLTTDVTAPRILWEQPGNAYFGYEGVKGKPVSEVLPALDGKQKRSIGAYLGSFLREFHTLQLPGARTITVQDEAEQIQRWYSENIEAMRQNFTTDEQQRLHHLVYEAWPAKLIELGSEPVLSHGDFHFENILYDQAGTVGVIDFGDVGYYDRSKDFLELEDDGVIYEGVMEAYGHSNTQLLGKIAARRSMIEIINFGYRVGKGDEAGIYRAVQNIKAAL